GKFIESQVFEDLAPYVERDDIDLERYFQSVIDSYWYQGTLPVLPKKISAPLMMYNKDFFNRAGVVFPSAEWTWSDLVESAEKLSRDINGDSDLDAWAFANGVLGGWQAPLMKGWNWTNEAGTKVPTADPRFYEALAFVHDLNTNHQFVAPAEVKEATNIP